MIDYTTQRFEEIVHDADVVLDAVGGDVTMRSFASDRRGGVVVSVSGLPDEPTARAWGVNALYRLGLAALNAKKMRAAKRADARYRFLFMRPDGPQLGEITRLVECGVIRPVVAVTYPLERAAEALSAVEGGRARGKVVFEIRGG